MGVLRKEVGTFYYEIIINLLLEIKPFNGISQILLGTPCGLVFLLDCELCCHI